VIALQKATHYAIGIGGGWAIACDLDRKMGISLEGINPSDFVPVDPDFHGIVRCDYCGA
jgi:hypothetical protein